MSSPAPETKDTAKKMTLGGVGKSLLGGAKKSVIKTVDFLHKKFGSTEHIDEGKKLSNTEYLGEIYKMMKVIDEDKKLQHEKAINHIEEEEHKKDQRNKEIISALTGKKFKKTKFKARRKFKVKKKGKATNVSESGETGGGGLGLPSLGTLGVIGTAAVVGTVAMTSSSSAFGNTTKMEQSASTREQQLAKAHQGVPDTDKSLSYGVIGLSSRRKGKADSSLDSFIKDNPQFNLPDPGAGGNDPKFLEQWNKIPADKLLDAQEKWYQEHVYNPTTSLLEQSGVDSKISKDERVRAFMADRANQGGVGDPIEDIKRAGASDSQTSEQFIDKMTEYDKSRIKIKYKSHLEQFPNDEQGLINRIESRRILSLGLKPNAEENKSGTNTKLNPKQAASAKSENLEIKDKTPTLTDEQLEKQRLEYEKQAESGMDMGYKLKYPEQKSSNAKDLLESQRKATGPESTGALIPKPKMAPLEMTEAERENYIKKFAKVNEDSFPRESQLSESDRKLWQQLELQDLIHKSTLLENQQKVNADLKAKEEDKVIEVQQTQVIHKIINAPSNETIEPPEEEICRWTDAPKYMDGIQPVPKQTKLIEKPL